MNTTNSRTDFANLWHADPATLQAEPTINPHLLRRAAAQRALALKGRDARRLAVAPLLAATAAALDALTTLFFERAFQVATWHALADGRLLTNLETGRLKSSAKARALRCLVGVSVPGDGDRGQLVQLGGPDLDASTEGATVRSWMDRARDRARVRPGLCTRAASGRPAPGRVANRRHPFRVPAVMLGPATAAAVPAP